MRQHPQFSWEIRWFTALALSDECDFNALALDDANVEELRSAAAHRSFVFLFNQAEGGVSFGDEY